MDNHFDTHEVIFEQVLLSKSWKMMLLSSVYTQRRLFTSK